MEYRLYTFSDGSHTSQVAIPENNVEAFDAHLSNLPESRIEDILNKFGAILIG